MFEIMRLNIKLAIYEVFSKAEKKEIFFFNSIHFSTSFCLFYTSVRFLSLKKICSIVKKGKFVASSTIANPPI